MPRKQEQIRTMPKKPKTPTDTPALPEWKYKWRNWLRPTKTPGLFEVKDGGFMFRKTWIDPTTGNEREIKRLLPSTDEIEAAYQMQRLVQEAKAGTSPSPQLRVRFADCAVEVFENKKANGDFKSDATVEKWKDTLAHLLAGTPPPPPDKPNPRYKYRRTEVQKSGKKVPGLGEVYIHMLEEPIKQWRKGIQGLIDQGLVKPSTANSWRSILRVLTGEITQRYKLESDPYGKFKPFDESEHETHTEEQPNALPPERAGEFLALIFQYFPQHYAMTYLGFVTGLRPSSLRPLRRSGPQSDVKWDTARLIVRRSQTVGERIMQTTKQKKRYAIDMPKGVFDILQWHVETQLRKPKQRASDLLFPSTVGGYRARSVLDKPFNMIAKKMKLGFRLTAKGMRRTFQDMHRLAKIEPLVTRSISGHGTEKMQWEYSTVQNSEQRESIAQVMALYGNKTSPRGAGPRPQPGTSGAAPLGENP
jgi:integrase